MLKPSIKNQKGMAIFEIVPLLAIFILLLNFAIGFFGAIHSGILNSIAARNYAFETFSNRTNLNYIRDEATSDLDFYFYKQGYRIHGIKGEGKPSDEQFYATRRSIKFTEAVDTTVTGETMIHNRKVAQIATGARASDIIEQDEFSKVWVRTLYGICLNKNCGD